jgi:hypothetical protein
MKKQYKRWIILAAIVLTLLYCLVGPSGLFDTEHSLVPLVNSNQILVNPEINGYHDGWFLSDWSSANNYPTSQQTLTKNGSVSLKQSGYDVSFYAVALCQGTAPEMWRSEPAPTIYASVNGSYVNQVTWTGIIESASTLPTGCLGVGIDFWFDAIRPDGTTDSIECYVFFYMTGVYNLPVGSYKYVARQDFNTSSSVMTKTWDYIYFHHSQDPIGVEQTHVFELNKYVEVFKQNRCELRDADFRLARVDCCMELFCGAGQFTVDYCGFEQAQKDSVKLSYPT